MVKQYLAAIRSLLRIPTYLLMLLYYTISFLVSRGGGGPGQYLLGALAIAAWYINATALNDLSDFEIDQINLKGDRDRPLVTGALSQRGLQAVAVASGAMALALAAGLSWPAAGVMVVVLLLNAAYSLPPVAISRRGGLALALLPVGYVGLTMTLGGLAGGSPSLSLAVLAAICYVQFLARISLKDYRDVIGDAKFGKRTFLLRHGSVAVVKLALICHIAAAAAGTWWLYPHSPLRAAGYVCLAAMAATFLDQLRSAPDWPQQRVWIAAYGRLVTGQLSVILLDALATSGAIPALTQQTLLLALLVGTFIWSSQKVVANLRSVVK
jgi:4-hydroxybenzoate polyprenyltransferase